MHLKVKWYLDIMRIGEIADRVGVNTSTIRYYEEAGLLPEPGRTPSGYREYDPSVVDRLSFIRAGQGVGLTLGELRDILQIRDAGEAPCHHVTELVDRRIGEIEERIRDLRRLRKTLVDVAAQSATVDPRECPPASVCRIIELAR